jgi:hypothetical protein
MVKEYPRVSQILSPYSGYSKVPKNILENACTRGTAVHQACSDYLFGKPITLNPEWKPYLLSFLDWADNFEEIHSTETSLQDHEWKYRGTYDYVAKVNGFPGYTLLDIKTAYAAKDIWGAQLAAYRRMLNLTGVEISQVCVLHLDRNGRRPKLISYDADQYIKDFEAMCKLYHKFNP